MIYALPDVEDGSLLQVNMGTHRPFENIVLPPSKGIAAIRLGRRYLRQHLPTTAIRGADTADYNPCGRACGILRHLQQPAVPKHGHRAWLHEFGIADCWCGPYAAVERLGRGGNASVFLAYNAAGGAVALKLEPQTQSSWTDSYYLQLLRSSDEAHMPEGFISSFYPRLLWAGSHGPFDALAMTLSGRSLAQLQEVCGGHFSRSTTYMVADQLLAAFEHIHSYGLIQRSVKAENMAVRFNLPYEIMLLDFGGAQMFVEDDGTHRPYQESECVTHVGYCSSLHQALGDMPSRRDDLECLAHTLIRFVRGCLPWEESRRAELEREGITLEEHYLRCKQALRTPELPCAEAGRWRGGVGTAAPATEARDVEAGDCGGAGSSETAGKVCNDSSCGGCSGDGGGGSVSKTGGRGGSDAGGSDSCSVSDHSSFFGGDFPRRHRAFDLLPPDAAILIEFLMYTWDLGYAQKPDYAMCRQCFREAFEALPGYERALLCGRTPRQADVLDPAQCDGDEAPSEQANGSPDDFKDDERRLDFDWSKGIFDWM